MIIPATLESCRKFQSQRFNFSIVEAGHVQAHGRCKRSKRAWLATTVSEDAEAEIFTTFQWNQYILHLAFVVWDPRPELFPYVLPLLGRQIFWYGALFALGFLLGYFVLLSLLRFFDTFSKKERKAIAEKVAVYVIIGTLLGAHLGDILFYQSWQRILEEPLSLIKEWGRGLASHGGAVGILCALGLLSHRFKKKYPLLTWRRLIDLLAPPTALAGGFIRIGNFFNQEILGKPTDLPWAVLFLHPADGGAIVPRHPVQLYESLYYFALFFLLYFLWKYFPKFRVEGKSGGLFFLAVFSFRFLIEYLKVEQSVHIAPGSPLTMGQYLSLPFILLGLWLFFSNRYTQTT